MTDITDKLMEQAQVFASAWAIVGSQFDHRDALEDAYQAKVELRRMIEAELQQVDRMRAAITAMIDGIERWLDTGTPAGPEESKAIYEQLCRSVGREPQP